MKTHTHEFIPAHKSKKASRNLKCATCGRTARHSVHVVEPLINGTAPELLPEPPRELGGFNCAGEYRMPDHSVPASVLEGRPVYSELGKKLAADGIYEVVAVERGTASPNHVGLVVKPSKSKLGERVALASRPKTDATPHLIVEARAGTGKTTTLVEGLKRVKGMQSDLVPSPQQAAVWDEMELSKGNARTICFCAFNRSIRDELQKRVPAGCDAKTMHGLGNGAVRKAFGNLQMPNDADWVIYDRIASILGKDAKVLLRDKPAVMRGVLNLVGLCKMNLLGWDGTMFRADGITLDELATLAGHYDVDTNGSQTEIFHLVPQVMQLCFNHADGRMDFADMIWLPVVSNLPIVKYDLLLIDELQDLSKCQQQLAIKCGTRIIGVGDPRQAIYGFAGADCESMSRMESILKDTPQGCVHLPLTVTRRCGRAIVKEANAIVADFSAHESNGEGTVSYAAFTEASPASSDATCYRDLVKVGDMILCRCNAPLVSECFRFIKKGIKAQIQGRDIGQGLINTVKKLFKADGKTGVGIDLIHASSLDLISRLGDWLHAEEAKENAKRMPSENRIIALRDRHDCLVCFCDSAQDVAGVIAKIEEVFSDRCEGIRLSSGHRAKGLEADRVFILQPPGAECPHPMAKGSWQREQEFNILYVMQTRAKHELVYVS